MLLYLYDSHIIIKMRSLQGAKRILVIDPLSHPLGFFLTKGLFRRNNQLNVVVA